MYVAGAEDCVGCSGGDTAVQCYCVTVFSDDCSDKYGWVSSVRAAVTITSVLSALRQDCQ